MIAVDLKITDYCSFNCPFCYQNSTLKGKHADWEYLKEVVDLLHRENVFEVVLGGGEPTFYPHFKDLLKLLLEKDFTVAITTKNRNAFDKETLKELERFGRKNIFVGFSFGAANELEKSLDELKHLATNLSSSNIYFTLRPHLIEGITFSNNKELEQAIQKIAQNVGFLSGFGVEVDGVLLLGYKTNGRGKIYPTHINKKSIQKKLLNLKKRNFTYPINKVSSLLILVDTALVDNYKEVFEDSNTFLLKEGEYTFYIDAVEKKIAISSYKGKHYPLENLKRDFYLFLERRKEEL